MTNIFVDGLTINQDGQEIKLTSNSIYKISRAIRSQYGRDSLEYVMETLEDDLGWYSKDEDRCKEINERLEKAKKLMDDESACCDIWDEYWAYVTEDTGDLEFDAVTYIIDNR